jgi:hypothetical protein
MVQGNVEIIRAEGWPGFGEREGGVFLFYNDGSGSVYLTIYQAKEFQRELRRAIKDAKGRPRKGEVTVDDFYGVDDSYPTPVESEGPVPQPTTDNGANGMGWSDDAPVVVEDPVIDEGPVPNQVPDDPDVAGPVESEQPTDQAGESESK